MDDSELQAIRQARLAELQKNGGQNAGQQQQQDQSQQASQEEEMRQSMMLQILSPQARERLSRIRIVRPQRAQSVEDLLIRMARSGQIRQKVSEEELVSLLDQISQQEQRTSQTKVVFTRRNDDDDDDYGKPHKDSHADSDEDDFFD
ncbi:hypothetical protein TRVA0_036S00166 [Trichomonascus vanleenenianus]|uniref:Sdd2p n=1 Tax=Trichomonascus vanleenenianus TaxID=2268995 RepID=UPI003ECAF5F5